MSRDSFGLGGCSKSECQAYSSKHCLKNIQKKNKTFNFGRNIQLSFLFVFVCFKRFPVFFCNKHSLTMNKFQCFSHWILFYSTNHREPASIKEAETQVNFWVSALANIMIFCFSVTWSCFVTWSYEEVLLEIYSVTSDI